MVTAIVLIDEGELSCGLQQKTLEDTEAAIHPPSYLHTPTAHSVVQTGISTMHCVVLSSVLVLNTLLHHGVPLNADEAHLLQFFSVIIYFL